MEPFDDSMPELLSKDGIYTHLVSDHYHYWQDGGSTYHTRYNSWEACRGQEGDPWKGIVEPWGPDLRDPVGDPDTLPLLEEANRRTVLRRQDRINRQFMRNEYDHPQAQTFLKGLEFVERNRHADNWFLQIETFDPHEPFFVPRRYKDLYRDNYEGPEFDWPDYRRVEESSDQVQHCKLEYAALVSMCDAYLGDLLDKMDAHDMWDDTMLIVTSDHGFLLGEHGWWGKGSQPFYNELARLPFFLWDPRARSAGTRRESLVQMIDIAPTLLDYFGVEIPKDMEGHSLRDTVVNDVAIRKAALFGIHEGHVNCTDGKYVYMRAPATAENRPLFNYTLMPTHVRSRFTIDELKSAELVAPFSFTKGAPVLKMHARHLRNADFHAFGSLLYDIESDPLQTNSIHNTEIEQRMSEQLVQLMQSNDCPEEQFVRLGLDRVSKSD